MKGGSWVTGEVGATIMTSCHVLKCGMMGGGLRKMGRPLGDSPGKQFYTDFDLCTL
jgi:hypothetical protein